MFEVFENVQRAIGIEDHLDSHDRDHERAQNQFRQLNFSKCILSRDH